MWRGDGNRQTYTVTAKLFVTIVIRRARKTLLRTDQCNGGFAVEGRDGPHSEYNKDEWGLIVRELGVGCWWKTTKRKHPGSGGILAKPT